MTAPRPTRVFTTADILAGRVSLHGYPFRHVFITISPSAMFSGKVRLSTGNEGIADHLLSAVEVLEAQGWELVNTEQGGRLACMRRVRPPHG